MSRAAILTALDATRAARDMLASGVQKMDGAIKALEHALEASVQEGVQTLPEPTAPPCQHRAAHRPGKPRRIDNDPELRAFIAARIDRLTFHQLQAEIAATFPPERHVGKSAMHAWWQRQKPGKKTDRSG
jgi:hypothetical protein